MTGIVADLVEPLDPDAAPAVPAVAGRVLCVGARHALDTAAAEMLAGLLRRHGLTVEVVESTALLHGTTAPGRHDVVCLSYLDAEAVRQARRLLLRVRARLGRTTPACIGLWGCSVAQAERAQAVTGAAAVTGSTKGAVEAVLHLLQPQPEAAPVPPAPPLLDKTA